MDRQASLLSRVRGRFRGLKDRRWTWYIRLGLNNLLINRFIHPLPLESLAGIPGVRTGTLDLSAAEYRRFVELRALAAYRAFDYPYSKVLEYLTSWRLTEPGPEATVLDAAGGEDGEYCRAILEVSGCREVYCQDSAVEPRQEGSLRFLGGSAGRVDLPAASLSAITCHHSLEHFQGDGDLGFIEELCRLLAPGGRACIVPLFLTRGEYEVWNVRPRARFDTLASSFWDPFATFPGWGPYEHFARTYSLESFRRRIVEHVAPGMEIEVVAVTYDGKPCPDLKTNRQQPRLNAGMKALVLRKPFSAARVVASPTRPHPW